MATFSKQSQHTATWGKPSSNAATWTKTGRGTSGSSFLLLENGSYILQEDGMSKLILEQSSSSLPVYTHMLQEVG